MQPADFPAVSLHNVAELESAAWADGGARLARISAAVGANLNVMARDRVRHPTGCELRFVPEREDAVVTVTLSAPEPTTVHPFWGAFQSTEPVSIDPGPTALEFALPDRIRRLELEPDAVDPFDPRVCRLRFDAWTPVAIHAVSGPCRPPNVEELPTRRYLAYGTSITEGADSDPHLSYVSQAARHLGVDPLNLGTSGSAYCEPAMAEYLAAREDWDFATISVSVNMANRGFTTEQFRERADHLVNAVAGAHPEKPVVCVTLFPYHADVVRGDDPSRAAAFREALSSIVEASPRSNLSLLEGPALLEPTGLSTDALHPGDDGMIQIGRRLAERLTPLVE